MQSVCLGNPNYSAEIQYSETLVFLIFIKKNTLKGNKHLEIISGKIILYFKPGGSRANQATKLFV